MSKITSTKKTGKTELRTGEGTTAIRRHHQKTDHSEKYANVNGACIIYKTIGDGLALLLLHGYSPSGAIFGRVRPPLEGSWTVITLDLLGYGLDNAPTCQPPLRSTSVCAGVAIRQVAQDGYTAAQDAGLEWQIFTMLDALPLSKVTSIIDVILVVVLFVTSSDAGSLVIDTIKAGGKIDAPMPQRVFWAGFEGAVAIVLLLGGRLGALQAMVISSGQPLTVILLMICVSLVLHLMFEKRNYGTGGGTEASLSAPAASRSIP